jgi:hypothetical protein
VIGGNITPDALDAEKIARIKRNVVVGGYIGQLVATDNTSAMVVADLLEYDPVTKKSLDYLDLADKLEREVRGKLETREFEIQIIGFAKQIGDIADGARSVARFFLLAFLLTAASVPLFALVAAYGAPARLLARVGGLAIRDSATVGLRSGSARGPGAFPCVRDRRFPRHPADQLHLRGDPHRRRHDDRRAA